MSVNYSKLDIIIFIIVNFIFIEFINLSQLNLLTTILINPNSTNQNSDSTCLHYPAVKHLLFWIVKLYYNDKNENLSIIFEVNIITAN
jgi:hypothetical protein